MVERQKNKNYKTKEEGKDGKKNGMTKEQWNDKRRMRERRKKQQKRMMETWRMRERRIE